MKLLIVDDEIWSRQLIKKVLPWQALGFEQIIEASDGQEAIESLEMMQIDLMITDMRMPKLDGAEMLKRLRASNNVVETIVMSGYEDYTYLHEALKTKAIDYLLKPIVKEELERAVLRALDVIHEKTSYHYIEQILIHEDLSSLLNKYYETKNHLFKALISKDLVKLEEQIDLIENLILINAASDMLKSYMKTDFMRFVLKLEKEYLNQKQSFELERQFDIKALQETLINIIQEIIHKDVYKKISSLDVQKYIDSHFTESISLSDIAEMFHVSKEHLSRLFKKDVGISVQNYILEKKIDHAKSLLQRYQKLSISTIGAMSGFTDNHYFYRVFKNKVGMTPVQYRLKKSI